MSSNGAQATCPSRKDVSNYLHAVYKQVLRVAMGVAMGVLIEVWVWTSSRVCGGSAHQGGRILYVVNPVLLLVVQGGVSEKNT